MTPDVVQTHGLDVGRLLSPRGTGLVWADVSVAEQLPPYVPPAGGTTFYEVVSPYWPRVQRTLLQVTNLGISVKDSPQSTLVFVTRLTRGARSGRLSDDRERRQSDAVARRPIEGVALAPAWRCARENTTRSSHSW
jgi:hypothetical protein